jgi:hypothetical protein
MPQLRNGWLVAWRKAGLHAMRIVFILIKTTRRNKEVKWCLKGLLGIMEERLPAIPARGAKGAWGIN